MNKRRRNKARKRTGHSRAMMADINRSIKRIARTRSQRKLATAITLKIVSELGVNKWWRSMWMYKPLMPTVSKSGNRLDISMPFPGPIFDTDDFDWRSE